MSTLFCRVSYHRLRTSVATKPVLVTSACKRPLTVCGDKECIDANYEKSIAFMLFRKHGSIAYYERYMDLEKTFKNLIKAKKHRYWVRFVKFLMQETLENSERECVMQHHRSTKTRSAPISGFLILRAKPVLILYVRNLPSKRNEMYSPFSMVEFSIVLLACNNSAS